MTNPIDAARQFYQHTVQPFLEDAGRVVKDVGGAISDVGGALDDAAHDVAGAVGEEGVLNVARDVVSGQARQGAEVLGQVRQNLQHGSPGEFVEWLTGPQGPSFADTTAQVPGLQQAIGDVIDGAMSNPLVAGVVGRAFGFEYVPEGDFYTTNESSLQSYLGFHDIYDTAGKALGMDLDDKVVEFEVDGTQYRLELWQGSYGSGGAFGGEIGLYTRNTGERGPLGDLLEHIPGYYSSAAGGDQIAMSQTIYNTKTGEEYFTNNGAGADDGEHYWNLAIRTDPGVSHEDIGQRGTLQLKDPDVAQAMCQAMRAQGIDAQLGSDGLTITYDWP